MSRVGFEPTIPAFDRAKTGHVLDRAANVMGSLSYSALLNKQIKLDKKVLNLRLHKVSVTNFLNTLYQRLKIQSG
jgi:hypothetical protein